MFAAAKITQQLMKFHWALAKLLFSLIATVRPLSRDPTAFSDPYKELQELLLRSYGLSATRMTGKWLDYPMCGNTRPSVMWDNLTALQPATVKEAQTASCRASLSFPRSPPLPLSVSRQRIRRRQVWPTGADQRRPQQSPVFLPLPLRYQGPEVREGLLLPGKLIGRRPAHTLPPLLVLSQPATPPPFLYRNQPQPCLPYLQRT